jgi:arsenate reductase
MTATPIHVLFLCTGNSARSIIAEALLNGLGGGRFRAFSAGSHPTGRVNPVALEVLARDGIPVQGLRSKSWDEFSGPGAPRIDFVITVCGNAAGEVCPVFPGKPVAAHWGVPDPAAVEGSDADKRRAFRATLDVMRRRVQRFTGLPFDSTDKQALKGAMAEIGNA